MQRAVYSFIVSLILFSGTTPLRPFLQVARRAGFYPTKYVSALESTPHHQESSSSSQSALTCAEDDLLSRLFPSPHSLIRQFHIHGWRWHSLALLRDFSRLEKLATKLSSSPTLPQDTPDRISKAIQHVVGFNWIGLYRIETQVFFPFLREKLLNHQNPLKPLIESTSTVNLQDQSSRVRESLEQVLKQMEGSRVRIDALSKEMVWFQYIFFFSLEPWNVFNLFLKCCCL
jgi:hypothetical protein